MTVPWPCVCPVQVMHMPLPEGDKLRKLLQLKADKGQLTLQDEKELKVGMQHLGYGSASVTRQCA